MYDVTSLRTFYKRFGQKKRIRILSIFNKDPPPSLFLVSSLSLGPLPDALPRDVVCGRERIRILPFTAYWGSVDH